MGVCPREDVINGAVWQQEALRHLFVFHSDFIGRYFCFAALGTFVGEGGRLRALGLNSFERLRSVDLRPVVALFCGLAARLLLCFPPQHVEATDPKNICLTECEPLPCVGHGVTNTSVWRVAVCRNDVRMTCEGCCLWFFVSSLVEPTCVRGLWHCWLTAPRHFSAFLDVLRNDGWRPACWCCRWE
ncbi:hypothetical protein TcYC6_0004790 [Trypanosoma cruzi]|nr:hypothetical protein TcYC6_0004790 [Trypanosoma cruzi]